MSYFLTSRLSVAAASPMSLCLLPSFGSQLTDYILFFRWNTQGDQIASLYDLLTFKDKPDNTRPSSEPQLGFGVAGRDGVARISGQPQQSSTQVAQALRAAGLGMKRHPTFA